jgi:CHAT domain-containing protein
VARTLGAALFAPLLPALGGTSNLIVAAEAPLSSVSLDAFFVGSERIAARWNVQYAPSLTVWTARAQSRVRRRGRAERDLVAIGAPDYAAMAATGVGPLESRAWEPLPGAAGELAAIAASFPIARREIVAGADATKARFVQLSRNGTLSSTRYLHIAAHGLLAADAPQWSSLVLGGDNGAPGYVTAAELATLDIRADLVVLSACETALGKEVAGEGLFGLPYALSVAGARATLLTLWPVADAPTALFMRRFYAKLARGDTPAEALARTKREFMRMKAYSAPFYWAPFTLYGA